MNTESLNIILTKFKEDKLTLEETSKLICSLNGYYYCYPYYPTNPWITTYNQSRYEINNENN